jgi:uncharacterized pyridoxamine 5'-phosphate oxidase family protein
MRGRFILLQEPKGCLQTASGNPNFEVSATAKDNSWIRLKGKAVFENNIEVKKKAFEILPALAGLYKTPIILYLRCFMRLKEKLRYIHLLRHQKHLNYNWECSRL